MRRLFSTKRVLSGLLLASLLGASFWFYPGAAQAQSTCPDNPDPVFSAESPTFENTDHAEVIDGSINFVQIFIRGAEIFETAFNECDGKGRPGATGSHVPTEREVGSAVPMTSVSGMEAGSCLACHNVPREGGAGDFAAAIFVTAEERDPQTFVADASSGNERASPILFGAGGIEVLAREMSYDLADLRDACRDQSFETGQTVTTSLDTHGVNFGQIVCFANGDLDLSGIEGVDVDLIVKPFRANGFTRSLRDFSVTPLNHHHGIQPEERFGIERTHLVDFDQDGVLTQNEATIGDVDVLTIWQAFLPVPGQVFPDDVAGQARVLNGEAIFENIGCTDCHVEELQTRDSEYFEPYNLNPPGVFNDPSSGIGFNLMTNGAIPRFAPVTNGATSGPMRVRLFSDLKRHIICDEVNNRFCNEEIQMGTVPTNSFITARLWGVGNSAPYGHRGDIGTLSEAILAHGGEATVQRNAFEALPQEDKEDVILFLKSLRVLPQGADKLLMLESEFVQLTNSHKDVVIQGGQVASLLDEASAVAGDVTARVPLNGGPLFFVVGLVAFPLLRRRGARYAMHVLVGALALSALTTGVSLATRDAIAPAERAADVAALQSALPIADFRIWGVNVPGDMEFNSRDIGIEPAQGVVPFAVTFNNLSVASPDTTFTWDFGDGSAPVVTNDLQQVRHVYTVPNVYQVTLTAQNSEGTDTFVNPRYVFANSPTPWFSDDSVDSGVISNHSPSGENALPFGSGGGWADFDNDGDEDLFVVQGSGRNWLWRNNSDGTFTNVAEQAGVADLGGAGLAMAWADYDNDGCQDLIVANFDPEGAAGHAERTRLYNNNCDGTFTDVAEQAGLAAEGWRRTLAYAWGDFNRDGLLDLYVVNHSSLNSYEMPTPTGSADILYQQNPDNTFTDVTAAMLQPINNTQGPGSSAAWVDFDKDGDQDLYVVNDRFFGIAGGVPPAKNVLWRNMLLENGTPGFQDVCSAPASAPACQSRFSMGMAIFDTNGDSFQDIVLSNVNGSRVLNGGAGLAFQDVTSAPGVILDSASTIGQRPTVMWGQYPFDFDNNAGMDLLQVAGFLNGAADEPFLQPNALFSNNGQGVFSHLTFLSGLGDAGQGRFAALADYDQDGWVDVYLGNYGEVGRLFHNDFETVEGSTNRFLRIKLIGNPAAGSSRDAIGARVSITKSGRSLTQIAGASPGGSSRILHFGVRFLTSMDSVTINWPSGQVQTLTNVATDQLLVVEEP